MSEEHDAIAERLAKKFRAKYYRKGIDVRKPGLRIEVALSEQEIQESIEMLKDSRVAKRYVATRYKNIDKAIKLAKRTGVGIMNTLGEVRKRTRKK